MQFSVDPATVEHVPKEPPAVAEAATGSGRRWQHIQSCKHQDQEEEIRRTIVSSLFIVYLCFKSVCTFVVYLLLLLKL